VKSYTQDTEAYWSAGTAALSNADLSGGSVGYFWIDEGNGQVVTCSATVGGVPLSASATFNVLSPRVDSFVAWMTSDSPPVNCDRDLNNAIEPNCLHFGHQPPGGSIGMTCSANVATPTGGTGNLGITQLVNFANCITRSGSSTSTKSSNNNYVLDDLNGVQYSGPDPIGNNDIRPIASADGPWQGLSGIRVTESFSAETYLMYKPSGDDSIWVTKAQLNWSFSGTCSRPPNGTWTMNGGTATVPTNGSPSTLLPTWSGRATKLEWQ
jgi:hypothetical protein